MKLRNIPSGPVNLKEPWVIYALGCPLLFLVFKWVNFFDWWNIFHWIGFSAFLAGVVILFGKNFFNEKYGENLSWISGLFMNWFFASYIISQITRER